MADYLIQDSTLTDIADAIRAKDGSSAPILTEDMADAIAAIPSGGSDPWELIVDYTSDAAATVVEATIPIGKQDRNVYRVVITVEFSDAEYPYLGVNGAYGSYEAASVPRNTTAVYEGFVIMRKTTRGGTVYKETLFALAGTLSAVSSYPFTSLNFKSYYANKIKAGCNIKVWGLKE